MPKWFPTTLWRGTACNSESAAAGAGAVSTPLATLLTRHLLRDGELVLLIIKPSIWFIPLSMLRFAGVAVICMIIAKIFDDQLPGRNIVYVDAGIFVLAGRLMWAVLQWMGRLYVLTELRVLRLSGVFNVNIEDSPLRKIARTRLVYTVPERLLWAGSVEIIPFDDQYSIQLWQTVARPILVREQIVATINRAQQGSIGCP